MTCELSPATTVSSGSADASDRWIGAHGPASCAASAAMAERAAPVPACGKATGPLLAQRREHVSEHHRGVPDDGKVGPDVLVHLRRVEVDADDGPAPRGPGRDNATPEVRVTDLGPDQQQHVGGVGHVVCGGKAHRGSQRGRVLLVEDALAVHGGQDRDAEVGQRADLRGSANGHRPRR